MTRKRTSPIWLKSKKEMQDILDTSSTFVEVLKELGLDAYSGNHRTLKERIKQDSLSVERLNEKRRARYSDLSQLKKIPISEIMVENSTYDTKRLKIRLVEEKILNYCCYKCGNKGEWMGKKLTLQLEHINGHSRDHRKENLCLLCPNCHSQTETYAGRNSGVKKSRFCSACGGATKGKGSICVKCAAQKQPKKFSVSRSELEKLVNKYPMTVVGKKFNVSDNAIRKRCRKLGIECPKNGKGYWTKKSE
jgi:hypothetical protein